MTTIEKIAINPAAMKSAYVSRRAFAGISKEQRRKIMSWFKKHRAPGKRIDAAIRGAATGGAVGAGAGGVAGYAIGRHGKKEQ